MLYERHQIDRLIGKVKAMEMPYEQLIFEKILDLKPVKYDTSEHLRQVPSDVVWEPIHIGDSWGGGFESMWLNANFIVPESGNGKKLVLRSNIGAHECLVFINDKPVGLFNTAGDNIGGNHSIVFVSKDGISGKSYDVALECYAGTPCLGCYPYENYGRDAMPNSDYIHIYNGLSLHAIREDVAEFLFDLRSMNQLLESLEPVDYFYGEVLEAVIHVYESACQYPLHTDENTWIKQMHAAHKYIKEILSQENNGPSGSVGLIGHSHMDTAWLWTVDETKRKCARTYANALSMMDWYDDYTFVQSSALHSSWMKQYYPSIFDDMKQRVSEGRYEPNGGVWVECDCNITGGESMVRQFLWGQRFTQKEFGYRSDTFWLPDTFGYNASIPQIMKGAGVDYFLTTKMEWNESNKFPFESFNWKGIDGTSVVTHLNRTHVTPDVQNIKNNYKNLPDKHVSKSKLVSYGVGDGGGGPQYQMVEMSKRVRNLYSCPKSEHTTVSKFMSKLADNKENLPTWSGELYLELHRGTLTMMHDMKRTNRLAEIALRELEALIVVSDKMDIYRDKLNDWWGVILLNQFHDILPGTSIPEVYDVAIPQNKAVISEVHAAIKEVLAGDDDEYLSVFNSLNWNRESQFSVPGSVLVDGCDIQNYIDIDGNDATAISAELPAMSITSYKLSEKKAVDVSPFKLNDNHLETPYANIVFAADGSIESFVDKCSGRELRREGGMPLNTLYFGEDVPLTWDNWDVDYDIHMKLKPHMNLSESKVVSNGKLQLRIENTYNIGSSSKLTQHMVFYSDTKRVDFESKLDWQEKHSFLRVGFDVDILSQTLKSEIQFGNADRPTYNNTSWDAAKSEVCNHKWSDLSENRFGVAILNDCKYGISCVGSDIQLSLHKGGCRPDPRGDVGVHKFTYSLLPHDGGFSTQSVVKPAYELNMKPTCSNGYAVAKAPLFTIDSEHIIVESLKPSEEGNGYVIRMYECECSCEKNISLSFTDKPNNVYETNMLEEIAGEIDIKGNTIKMDFKPFEIKTLLVQ